MNETEYSQTRIEIYNRSDGWFGWEYAMIRIRIVLERTKLRVNETIVCADWDVLTWQCSEPNWYLLFRSKAHKLKRFCSRGSKVSVSSFLSAVICCWLAVSDLLCAQCVCVYCCACVFCLFTVLVSPFVLPLSRFVQCDHVRVTSYKRRITV